MSTHLPDSSGTFPSQTFEVTLTPEQMAPEVDAIEPGDAEVADLAARLASRDSHENRGRLVRGLVLGAGAVALTGGLYAAAHADGKVTRDLPFSQVAQDVVEEVDTVLSYAGTALLPASVAAMAAAKIGSRYSPRLRAADKLSSKELSDDGKANVRPLGRTLRRYAAGGIPLVATGAVIVGADMAAVGSEIGTGPDRPIVNMFDSLPGEGPYSVVAQDGAADPMLQSYLSRPLVGQIMKTAEERGVSASPVDLFLPSISHDGQNFSSLVIAFPEKPGSELAPADGSVNCEDVPVKVDKSAGIPVGDHIRINGVEATVVGENTGTSAINRIGVEMNREAVAECLYNNPEMPDSMVILDTDQATAQDILSTANAELHQTAAVITEKKYIGNSEDFWTANSKPVTNVLALMAAAMSFVSMDKIMESRMLRNRREWATKLAQGVGVNQLRMTELLRATKDGTVASVVGVVAATGLAPAINFLESGLRVGMDFRSAMVGCAVGILGSVGGTLHRVLRPHKTINVAEDTRI